MKSEVRIMLALIAVGAVILASIDFVAAESLGETLVGFANGIFNWWVNPETIREIVSRLTWSPKVFCFPEEEFLGICEQNPGMKVLQGYFIDILVPFYIAALMLNAVYFIFMSGSPKGRARSKLMFQKLIISMMFVIISPILFQFILDIAAMLTDYIYDHIMDIDSLLAQQQDEMTPGGSIIYFFITFIFSIILLLTLLLVIWRYLVLFIYAVLFPFIIFLYFFEFTKGTGRKYIQSILKWAFVPVIQIMLFGFALTSMTSITSITLNIPPSSNIPGTLVNFIVTGFGFFAAMGVTIAAGIMVLISPMIMVMVLNTVSEVISTLGYATCNPQLLALGGLVAGRETGITAAVTYRSMLNSGQAHKNALSHGQGMARRSFTPAPVVRDRQAGGGGGGGGGGWSTPSQTYRTRGSRSITGESDHTYLEEQPGRAYEGPGPHTTDLDSTVTSTHKMDYDMSSGAERGRTVRDTLIKPGGMRTMLEVHEDLPVEDMPRDKPGRSISTKEQGQVDEAGEPERKTRLTTFHRTRGRMPTPEEIEEERTSGSETGSSPAGGTPTIGEAMPPKTAGGLPLQRSASVTRVRREAQAKTGQVNKAEQSKLDAVNRTEERKRKALGDKDKTERDAWSRKKKEEDDHEARLQKQEGEQEEARKKRGNKRRKK
ncbi:hypothetical protein ACFLRC_02745 [Candidatus Altiarchaeota archaeon]